MGKSFILNWLSGGISSTYSVKTSSWLYVNSDLLMSLVYKTCVTSTLTLSPSRVLSCTIIRHEQTPLIAQVHFYKAPLCNIQFKIQGFWTHTHRFMLVKFDAAHHTPHKIHSKPSQGTKGNCRIAYKKIQYIIRLDCHQSVNTDFNAIRKWQ